MNREICAVYCSCGGKPKREDTTDEEEREHGCGTKECCVRAWECPKCKTRWTFSLWAPEME